jgi:single-stranded DNA-binding protein
VNVAIVVGRLSSAPRLSEFESGDVLVRYEITVDRSDGPADSVPVAWLGPAGKAPPGDLEAGEQVVAFGRVRRRWFRAGAGPSRSSTEVVAERVARSADKRKAAAVLAKAVEAVQVGGDAGG